MSVQGYLQNSDSTTMNTDGFKIKLNMSSKVKSCKPVFQRSNCLLLQTDRQYFDFFSSFRILGEVKLDFFPKVPKDWGNSSGWTHR